MNTKKSVKKSVKKPYEPTAAEVAYGFAVIAHRESAKLLLDILNWDPSGAGVQYPPCIIEKAEFFLYAVQEAVDKDHDVLFCDLVYKMKPTEANPRVPKDDKWIGESLNRIANYAKAAVSALHSANLLTKCVRRHYEELVAKIEFCDEFYFESGFKASAYSL